jgi:uncharacterized protein YijF (DUF1287 family)
MKLHTPTQPQAPSPPLVAAARAQIGVTTRYDPAYQVLAIPAAMPLIAACATWWCAPCASLGLDPQARVRGHAVEASAYPAIWGLSRPDRNIDHRRVPNLMRWFERQGWQQPVMALAADYAAGDIVAWKLNGNGLLHGHRF